MDDNGSDDEKADDEHQGALSCVVGKQISFEMVFNSLPVVCFADGLKLRYEGAGHMEWVWLVVLVRTCHCWWLHCVQYHELLLRRCFVTCRVN